MAYFFGPLCISLSSTVNILVAISARWQSIAQLHLSSLLENKQLESSPFTRSLIVYGFRVTSVLEVKGQNVARICGWENWADVTTIGTEMLELIIPVTWTLIFVSSTHIIEFFFRCSLFWRLVWRSGNGVGHINEVKLRRARLLLGLVTTVGGSTIRYFPGRLS